MAYGSHQIVPRGIYAFVLNERIVYVGSSALRLSAVEWNHRNAFKIPNFRISHFREQLMTAYKGKGLFKWLVEPVKCTQLQIETGEKAAIAMHNPWCNIDKDPVASSRRYGRY